MSGRIDTINTNLCLDMTGIPCVEDPTTGKLYLVVEICKQDSSDVEIPFKNPWVELADLLRVSEKWERRKAIVVFGVPFGVQQAIGND